MAKKTANVKKKPKKKTRKKTRKKPSLKQQLFKAAFGLTLLTSLVIIAGLLSRHLTESKKPVRQPVAATPVSGQKKKVVKIPAFEIYPEKDPVPAVSIPDEGTDISAHLPEVALIIDDLGYDRQIANKFLGFDAAITFSILPHSPFMRYIAEKASYKGFETMLHLPMEPREFPTVDPGPGALLTSMTPDALITQLYKDLDALPSIKGVNNHMGSKMTAQSSQMHQIFSVLKKRDLYFIDSRTAADTICKPSARLFGLPFAERDVFLDHVQEPEVIRRQIEKLIRIAKRKGKAIGIAHPHIVTYRVLKEVLPDLKTKVQLVPASTLAQAT